MGNRINSEKRVCVLVDSFYPVVGGGESHAKLLSTELVNLGYKLFVLTRRRVAASPVEEELEGYRIYRVGPVGMPRFGKYVMYIPAFFKAVSKRNDFDIIYVSVFRSSGILGVCLARLLGKKCVLRAGVSGEMTGDSLLAEYSKKPVMQFILKVILSMRNAVLRQADAFVSISEEVRDDFLKAGAAIDRICHVPNGVDTKRFYPAAKAEKDRLRDQLKLPNGTLFAYSGKLNRGKGLELILEVWPEIVAAHSNTHMLFIGGGQNQHLSFEKEIREITGEKGLEGSVHFSGYVTDVEKYLRACDYFVFPSESEGMPNALLEAMACGLPAIATRIGGNTDIIAKSNMGVFIPVRDAEALKKAMLSLLAAAEQAKKYAVEGRRRIEEVFSLDAMVAGYDKCFSGLCGSK